MSRPQLLFISPRFLFPAHSGGAIRTGQILRGMKGGRFKIKLISPGSPELAARHRNELDEVADEWEFWPSVSSEDRSRLSKARYLFSPLPLSVAADRSTAALALVKKCIQEGPDVAVADFAHSAVLLPARLDVPLVVFTHNCEAEIYERHGEQSRGVWRAIWRRQAVKMKAFEQGALARADAVVAVAERDARRFERDYRVSHVQTIPTGVELGRFPWSAPSGRNRVVFAGSMDSPANIDGVEWMIERVWTHVLDSVPTATMTVIGKEPPLRLVRLGQNFPGWRFTGRVDDVRPLLEGADAFVIPLRVGGGTRMKAFEAMAAGVPVVSTSIGVEGLGLESGGHFLVADDPLRFADAVARLLREPQLGLALSAGAREFVERRASHDEASRRFEEICWNAVLNRCGVSAAPRTCKSTPAVDAAVLDQSS